MLRENWIDFVCVVAIVGFALVVGFVGCQRSAHKRESRQNSVQENPHLVVYGDGRALATPLQDGTPEI